MAATQVQAKGEGKAVVGDQTQTVTFDSPPTEGNLLICLGNIDDGFTATMASAGWAKINQDGSGAPGAGGVAGFWKIAGEGESSAVEMDYGEANRRGAMIIYEYSNPDALEFDQYAATFEAAGDNTKSTGTTPALSSNAVLAICVLALGDDGANLAGTSWTNGFVGDVAAETFLVDFFSAVQDLDGSDVDLESVATYNGATEAGTHGLYVFKTAAAGNGLASFRDAVATAAAASDVAAADAIARDVGA